MLAIIGGTGLTRCRPSRSRTARSCARPTASRRRAAVRQIAGATPSSWRATGTATRSRRTGSTTAPTCGRSRSRAPRVHRGGLGRRHPRLRARRPRAAAPAHRLHVGRAQTFFDGGDQQVVHVDFTHPYTPALRATCLAGARRGGIPLQRRRRLRRGQRPAPRDRRRDRPHGARRRHAGRHDRHARGRARARARLPYAAICVVVNHAAGRGDSAAADLDGRHRARARDGDGQGARAARSRRAAASTRKARP